MPEARTVDAAQGVRLATEAFGPAGGRGVLLIMGATASMLEWPDALCEDLAARGLRVVRFDHRDTGRSTTRPPGPPAYAVEDMADDVLAVMDGWGMQRADLVGMSLGAYVAQVAALRHPARVRSLTLYAGEPLGWDGPPLPGLDPAFLELFGRLGSLDWSDRGAVAAALLEGARLAAGPSSFDEAAERRRIAADLDRADSPESALNHGMLSLRDDWTGRARDIAAPTLVLHGTEDPILPLPNGEALAATIPGARLVVLPGLGHALPPARLPEIAGHLAAFLDTVPMSGPERTP